LVRRAKQHSAPGKTRHFGNGSAQSQQPVIVILEKMHGGRNDFVGAGVVTMHQQSCASSGKNRRT
jgi:hypothetical protein